MLIIACCSCDVLSKLRTTTFEISDSMRFIGLHVQIAKSIEFLRRHDSIMCCVLNRSKLTKQSKKRFTSMVKDKPLHSSFAKKMEIKLHAKIVKTEEDRMKAIKSAKLQVFQKI